MPKHKPEHEYVTSNNLNGKTWREISEVITEKFGKASIAGVRHTYYAALKKVAVPVLIYHGIEPTEENVTNLARSEDFQILLKNTMEENDNERNK